MAQDSFEDFSIRVANTKPVAKKQKLKSTKPIKRKPAKKIEYKSEEEEILSTDSELQFDDEDFVTDNDHFFDDTEISDANQTVEAEVRDEREKIVREDSDDGSFNDTEWELIENTEDVEERSMRSGKKRKRLSIVRKTAQKRKKSERKKKVSVETKSDNENTKAISDSEPSPESEQESITTKTRGKKFVAQLPKVECKNVTEEDGTVKSAILVHVASGAHLQCRKCDFIASTEYGLRKHRKTNHPPQRAKGKIIKKILSCSSINIYT